MQIKKTCIPMRSIIAVDFIKDSYVDLRVEDHNIVITIPYDKKMTAKAAYKQLKEDLNFLDYMCYNCGCWFKNKTVWVDGKHNFCSQKCIDKWSGLRK